MNVILKFFGRIFPNHDSKRLLAELERIANGDYTNTDPAQFANPAYGTAINDMLHTIKFSNNDYVLRLNSVLEDIGDNSYIKNMMEQVSSQTEALQTMQNSGEHLRGSIDDINTSMATIQKNAHRIFQSSKTDTQDMEESIQLVNHSTEEIENINQHFQDYTDKIDKIGKITDSVKRVANQTNLLALNATVEAARAGESGKGFAVVADQLHQLSVNAAALAENITEYVDLLQTDTSDLADKLNATTVHLRDGNSHATHSLEHIRTMHTQIHTINDEVDSIFSAVDTQSNVTKKFTEMVTSLSESYHSLYRDCMHFGSHIYRDSRYIDKARSDLFRGLSSITPIDLLHIFETDHSILMWRVYSNIVDLEHLQLKQLNKPDNCKLGKWLLAQTDSRIRNSAEFQNVYDAHRELHDFATQSFLAKQKNDISSALSYFDRTYEAYFSLKNALADLQTLFQSIGMDKESKTLLLQDFK